MSQEVKGGSTGGVGFVGLLQLVFIILKWYDETGLFLKFFL